MTTPPDRSRQGQRWLPAVGLALLFAFAAVGWVQTRQVSLLSGSVRYDSDYLVWSFFQMETELMQLRDELREASHHPDRLDAEAVRQRFELFASRIPLVDESRTAGELDLGPTHRQGLEALRAFVAEADPLLAETSTATLDSASLERLVAGVSALIVPVHDLTLLANQLNAELVGRRNDAVREQIRLGIGLTVFLCALTLAFAVLSARQVRLLVARRRELERSAEVLQVARREAEAASEAKSAFLATMSHELRTPLNGVLGMLSLLEPGRLDSEQLDQVRTAHESATHLLDLLNDILDLSKLESGQLEVTPEALDLQRLLHDVDALMQMSAQAGGLVLTVQADAALPARVLADGKRLKQILFNLLSNAVKFTERGQVMLHADLQGGADGAPRQLRFRVTDTGIGMDEATLSRLFQRFVQGDAGIGRRYGGTGLGLEISRTLARLMGGDITAQSRRGEGSTFTVLLPMTEAADPVTPTSAAMPLEDAPRSPLQRTLPGLDLLVVDDHATNRKYMLTLLQRLGHRVRTAEDGALALQAVQQQAPDLVFMDLHMPVMDGLQATKAIRQLPGGTAAVPIVAVTADAFRETRDRLLAAGMSGFLTKPAKPADIEALLAATFPDRPAMPPAAAEPVPAPDSNPPPAPARPRRRRFRQEDRAEHLDMDLIGEVCVGITLEGYRTLLAGVLGDESGSMTALLAALDAGDTAALPELAHAVKGSHANVGLKSLRALAWRAEEQGAGFSPEQCARQAAELRAALDTSKALCERMGLA